MELDSWPPPYYSSAVVPIWEADFRPLSLGNPGALPSDLLFSRLEGGKSVQTSLNTILGEGPGGFAAADEPRVGQPRGNDSRGLCLEDVALNMAAANDFVDPQNRNGTSLRDISSAADFPIAPSGGATFSAGSTPPDGVGTAGHIAFASGGFGRGRFNSNAGGDPGPGTQSMVLSAWYKATTAVQMGISGTNGAGGVVTKIAFDLSATNTWRRLGAVLTGVPTTYTASHSWRYLDGRDYTAQGGIAATAMDTDVDLIQLEAGRVMTNWIPPDNNLGVFVRDRERLYHPDRADLIVGGRFSFEAIFCPEGGPTDYGVDRNVIQSVPTTFTDLHVWFVDANNRAYIEVATGEVHCVVNGTDHTLTPALSWTVGQMVDLYLAAGNGVPEGAYRLSSDDGATWGASIPLSGGSAQASIGTTGSIDLFCRQGEDTFSSYINILRAYDNQAPTWV